MGLPFVPLSDDQKLMFARAQSKNPIELQGINTKTLFHQKTQLAFTMRKDVCSICVCYNLCTDYMNSYNSVRKKKEQVT